MDVKPNYISMDSVFSENTLFRVPKYQRAYSWETDNVQQLCDDIELLYKTKIEEGLVNQHFLGGIVCVKEINKDELDDKTTYQLVDGQQRLSTTVLMVSRIINFINQLNLNEQLSEVRGTRVNKYKEKYIKLSSEENGKLIYFHRLTLSLRDKDYYSDLISEGKVDLKTKVKSHQLINKSTQVIDKFVKKICTGDNADIVEKVDLLYKIISKSFKVLVLRMVDVQDAYRLFQVINDRGRSLTAGDLLRATSLGVADQSGCYVDNMGDLEEFWDEITKNGSQHTDEKLIAYYVSTTAKNCQPAKLFEKFNSEFFCKPKEIGNIVKSIRDKSDLYDTLNGGKWPYKESQLTAYQKNKLKNLVVKYKHTKCLPLLMAATNLSEKKFYQLLFFLEKFFFVFKVCLEKRMGSVITIYLRHIKKINDSHSNFQVKWFVSDIREVLIGKVSKAEFRAYLDNLNYQEDGDNKDIKFLLVAIEENWRWLELNKKNGLLGMYKHHSRSLTIDSQLYTIEHIYPNNAKNIDEVANKKNHISNLTLLEDKDNQECGNKSLEEKIHIYKRSRININHEITEIKVWNLIELEKRKDLIYSRLESIFFFNT